MQSFDWQGLGKTSRPHSYCFALTGAPHELPAWVKPGDSASMFSSGPPRSRQKTSAALGVSSNPKSQEGLSKPCCPAWTGAPHELPAWARPGNIASKSSSGPPRKRQKTSKLSAAVVTPDPAALPPPQAYGQSQISITGQPQKPTKEGKRPHKRKMPASSANMQAKHHISSGSIGSVGKVPSSQVDTPSLGTFPWHASEASVGC